MSRLIILALLMVCALSKVKAQPTLSETIVQNVSLRVENNQNVGIVIGLIDEEGVNYYAFGVKSFSSQEPVDEKTVFEIGSITKTFTGILLADQVKKGALKLEDSLALYLSQEVSSPSYNGEPVRLIHLANHTSGLPRLPSNLVPENMANPYADYSEKQLYDFLHSYELKREVGAQYEYSNYGMGLLGQIIASRNEVTYETLMLNIIAKPLKLKNTRITLSPKMKKNWAEGHNMAFEVESWDLPTLAGAGAIRSTAKDMIKYLSYNMGLKRHKLYPAMQLSHQSSRSGKNLPVVGLAWHRTGVNTDFIWHNGGTGGFRSFAGFSESEKRGVVILSNSNESVDDLGFHILNPMSPLKQIKPSIAIKVREAFEAGGMDAASRTYMQIKKEQIQAFEFGEFELVRLANSYLTSGKIKQGISVLELNASLYPESSITYGSLAEAFLKDSSIDKAVSNFKKSLELNPASQQALVRLKELGVDTEELTREVKVNLEILEGYIGKYALAPGLILTISIDNNQLFAQATGQAKFPIFPKSQNVFYLKVIEAQLTFNTSEDEIVESITLLQGGKEIVGKKL